MSEQNPPDIKPKTIQNAVIPTTNKKPNINVSINTGTISYSPPSGKSLVEILEICRFQEKS